MLDENAQCFFLDTSHVVEFQHDDVGLAAIDAWMLGEIGIEKEPILIAVTLRMMPRPSMKSDPADSRVICPAIDTLAFTAHGVAYATALEPEPKRFIGLDHPAAPTRCHARIVALGCADRLAR
jgi:hypothetical protein